MVNLRKTVPYLQEVVFQFRVVGDNNIEEPLYGGLLLRRELYAALHFVECLDVREHRVGISHVLVDVVEVGNHQLSPSEELVEREVCRVVVNGVHLE